MATVKHTFMPGQTIQAAIRKHNKYTDDSQKLKRLMEMFNELNGCRVIYVGETVDIPILETGDK